MKEQGGVGDAVSERDATRDVERVSGTDQCREVRVGPHQHCVG